MKLRREIVQAMVVSFVGALGRPRIRPRGQVSIDERLAGDGLVISAGEDR
jgi:hypothetical protein